MSDDRAIVYFDPKVEKWVYRASSVGRPLRCLVSARQGYTAMDPPKYLLQYAEAGNRAEIIVKAMLRAQGYRISGEQNEVMLAVGETAVIRGHMDAEHIVDTEGVDRPLEVKSMGKSAWEDWHRGGFANFPEYADQMTVYMHAVGEKRGQEVEGFYAIYNRANPGELITMVLKEAPSDIAAIREKVATVEAWGENGLPQCTGAKYACGYDYMCDRNEIQFEELESGTKEVLTQLGEEYNEIVDAMEELEIQKELKREEIRTAMGEKEKVAVSGWSFTYKKPDKPGKTLNTVKLRETLGGELDKYYEDKKVERTLTIRRRST